MDALAALLMPYTKDQDRKIKNLEEKVDRMGSSFDELKELLIKKLG